MKFFRISNIFLIKHQINVPPLILNIEKTLGYIDTILFSKYSHIPKSHRGKSGTGWTCHSIVSILTIYFVNSSCKGSNIKASVWTCLNLLPRNWYATPKKLDCFEILTTSSVVFPINFPKNRRRENKPWSDKRRYWGVD